MTTENTANGTVQATNPDANPTQAVTPTVQATQEPNSQNPTQPNTVDQLPAWAQKLITEARDEAAKFRTEKQKAAEQAQLAEQERLKKQGEFQSLYEQEQAARKERETALEEAKGRLERFNKLALDRVQAETKDWPAKVKALLPQGESVDALEYAEAVEKFRPLVEEMKIVSAPGARPNQPRPAGNGQQITPLVSATKRF
jgi:hypothetical protein